MNPITKEDIETMEKAIVLMQKVLVTMTRIAGRQAEHETIKHKSFYVYHVNQWWYTIIGATNVHHAYNKATKELKNWSGIVAIRPDPAVYSQCSVADFNRLT